MEATGQATQRAITLSSFALVRARWRVVHIFNEMLIQYRYGRRQVLRQVVPDNMVVLCDQPLTADTSFNVPLEPAGPFWVMEYVSKSNPRKDYEDSFDKYERKVKKASQVVEAESFSFEGAYEATQQALTRHPELTALFCANDEMAAGALRAAHELGLHAPRDFSVVGFDGDLLDFVGAVHPDGPVVAVHGELEAAEEMIDALDGNLLVAGVLNGDLG